MLTLQRASAGSGKTYTLTRRYIGLLISIKDPGATRRRLRTRAELADSVQHILAVTFTNKATNEMKERIVSKLSELAYPPASGKKPDYLDDFTAEYSVTAAEVSEACREALHQLLYEYSDFNISTIDAFFQNILRTFAYESELPDSYQVVIDFDYLARLAAQGLVEDLAHGEADPDDRFWISQLINDSNTKGESNWNLFQRRVKNRSIGAKGVFGILCDIASQLEKPETERVVSILDEYELTGLTLREAYNRIEEERRRRSAELFGPLIAASAAMLREYGRYIPEEAAAAGIGSAAHQGAMAALLPNGKTTYKYLCRVVAPDADPLDGDIKFSKLGSKFLASKISPAKQREMADLQPVYEHFLQTYQNWRAYIDSQEVVCWSHICQALPRVALLNTLRGRINAYLTENDAMKMADTNAMIHRIIADDDVPFIYERLGTRLNHFLMDEFQDTSLLQWENFRPLLEESESHDHDNLIIGDAKQSIYRFRSAEPTLITDIVPACFPGLQERGFSVAENSNWRSRQHVVRFNNLFFRVLSERVSPAMATLYSNTVQLPRSSADERGYVEVNFYDKTQVAAPTEQLEDSDAADDSNSRIPAAIVRRIGQLITSLLRRGYHQKEIAILVSRKETGKQLIAGLMDYNTTLRPTDDILEFVSEDSLTLDTSGAVSTVIECFRLIQRSVEGKRSQEIKRDARGSTDWVEIQNNFRFFSARYPELSLSDRLQKFFEEGMADTMIDDMVAGMEAVTLPSLTEALTELFTTESQRRLQAPFLAAFQDAILDYCELHPTDIGSMLRWWDATGHSITINSPEDTDAINVMTIHKSKGLEFECVILPDIDIQLSMARETLWVNLPADFSYAPLLPKMLPIELMRKAAESTPWSERFAREEHHVQVDQLNKAYVAMTRAVSEMYIFLPAPFKAEDYNKLLQTAEVPEGQLLEPRLTTDQRSTSRLRHHAYEICRDADEQLTLLAEREEAKARLAAEEGRAVEISEMEMLPAAGEICHGADVWSFRYGAPIADVASALSKSRAGKMRDGDLREITQYFVNSDREILKFHPEHTPYISDVADEDRIDPRSEGSLKHAVLELVERESDLHTALERLRGRGMITRKVMRRYEAELSEALAAVRHLGWYDGSRKVLNERPMLRRGLKMKRPDRVMVSAEGDAIVVDYKFGDKTNSSEHRRQVGEYIGWMQAMGIYRSVKGYLWYVAHGEIEEVTRAIPPKPLAPSRG